MRKTENTNSSCDQINEVLKGVVRLGAASFGKMLLCWVLFTTLLGVYLENVSPENSRAVYKGAAEKDFTPNKDTGKAENEKIRPQNKFQKPTENFSLLRETLNWKTSKNEDTIDPENRKVQSFQKPSVETKKTKRTLMPGLETTATQMGKHSFVKIDRESTNSTKTENDTSLENTLEQSSTIKQDPNGNKTHPDTEQLVEMAKYQEAYIYSGSGSDQSPQKKTIPTQITEKGRTNARKIEDTRITILKNTGRSSIDTRLLSESQSKNWFVVFYTQTQYQGMEAANNCGTRTNPCYYLKTVMNQLKEGDTLTLISDQAKLISGQNELNKPYTEKAVESTS